MRVITALIYTVHTLLQYPKSRLCPLINVHIMYLCYIYRLAAVVQYSSTFIVNIDDDSQ